MKQRRCGHQKKGINMNYIIGCGGGNGVAATSNCVTATIRKEST
jgi:hypothetical protein